MNDIFAGVSCSIFGVLHTSLPGTLVMMIFVGFFLEVRSPFAFSSPCLEQRKPDSCFLTTS